MKAHTKELGPVPSGAGAGGDRVSGGNEGWDGLATVVRAHAETADACERAEIYLLERAFRERLALLHIELTPELAVALMAAATFLAEYTPEWGGDARCSLGEIALLGLRLLEGEPPAAPA